MLNSISRVFCCSQAAVLHVFTAEGRNHYCYVEDRAVVDSELETSSVASSSSSPASSSSSSASSSGAAAATGSTASSGSGAGPSAPFVHNAKPLSVEFKRELRATIAASAARFRSQQRDAQAARARQSARLGSGAGSGARTGTGTGAAAASSGAAGAAAVDAAKLVREAREKSEHEDEQARLAARRRAALLATL
jgi:hypothetical protein